MNVISRAQGCLLGLACGDAVGATLEFVPRHKIRSPLTDMEGGGKFRLDRGQWTDDTAMALCLADSLLACGGFDPIDQLDRYWRWAEEGYNSSRAYAFGFGQHTLKSLDEFYRTRRPYSLDDRAEQAGNGSLMRLAPIALFYCHQPQHIRRYAELSSQTTHAAQACLQACGYFAEVLAKALLGSGKAELFDGFSAHAFAHIAHIVRGDYCSKTAAEVKGPGYVAECLEAALWAFRQTESFREAVLLAANLGDDADTTAAVCGQIAGAFYGVDGIPPQWLEWLYRKDDIALLAERLAVCGGQGA